MSALNRDVEESDRSSPYLPLRRALSVHLRLVGDLVDLDLHDAARHALSVADAIRLELEAGN